MKIDINKHEIIPAILNYNYGTFIRARGELLLKNGKLSQADWVSLLKTKDEDFCTKIGCSLKELRDLQTALPYSDEYDQPAHVKIPINSRVRL